MEWQCGVENAVVGDVTDMSVQADSKLLEMLVCPASHVPLRYDAARQELISDQAKKAYPVRDGIPVMLPDEARALDDHEVKST